MKVGSQAGLYGAAVSDAADGSGRGRLRSCCALALFLLSHGRGLGHHLPQPFQPADPETQGGEPRSSQEGVVGIDKIAVNRRWLPVLALVSR